MKLRDNAVAQSTLSDAMRDCTSCQKSIAEMWEENRLKPVDTASEVDDGNSMESESTVTKESRNGGGYVKTRYVVALMAFLCMCTLQIMRISVNVAVVAMVNLTNDAGSNNSTICAEAEEIRVSSVSEGEFSWTKTQVGTLLASYYFGYPLTNLFGGYMVNRFGARVVVGLAMMSAAILTAIIPVTARLGFTYLIVTRALVGFSQGPCSPGMHCLFGKWAPPLERSLMVSVALAGTNFGSTAIMPIAGVLTDRFGWESVFYFSGGVAGAFSIAFICIVYSSPGDHPRISEEEKNFITKSITGKSSEKLDDEKKVPWCSVATSLPVWAMVIATCTSNWGDYVVIALLPTYMTAVLGYNLSTMGVLASLPFVVNFAAMIGTGYLTDVARSKNLMNTTNIRKTNTVVGLVGPAVFLVLAVSVGCNLAAAVAFFTISVGFAAFTAPGMKANSLDIAPQYSGILWGIATCLSNVAGMVSIQVAGWMLDIDDSVSQWRRVFWLASIVYCGGAVLYVIFGSGVMQSWALEDEHLEAKPLDEKEARETTPFEA